MEHNENESTTPAPKPTPAAVVGAVITDAAIEREYFFPTLGVTVKATSLEEAEAKAKSQSTI